MEAKEIVNYISVVNDAAERGVKFSSDFVTSSRNEYTYQDNLQHIKEDRKHVQNLRVKNSSRKKLLRFVLLSSLIKKFNSQQMFVVVVFFKS